MQLRFPRVFLGLLVLTSGLFLSVVTRGQEQPTAPANAGELPPSPQGVEVQARGPIHEAFASPTTEPVPTKPIPKQPPKPLEEMPPDQKPEGNAVWIGGYWGWDDERNDFLWVSGTWRVSPPGKSWVAGYWKEDGQQWHWVPGFWTTVQQQTAATTQQDATQQVKYLPEPPQPPPTAAPGEAPSPEAFYVPGQWMYHDAGYGVVGGASVWREAGYSWQPAYWARVQPGYVWVSAHYRWTPAGYIFVGGYWDFAITRRGFLYAPVVVDTVVVGPTFVYTPAYAIHHGVIVDVMFVRPSYCHYYYGDYYGPAYRTYGYESCIVYSRGHYDAIFVYERYEHRHEPAWERTQINIVIARNEGRAPRPPRVVDHRYISSPARVAAANHMRVERVEPHARVEAYHHAQSIQRVSAQRNVAERPVRPGEPIQPHTAALSVPHPQTPAAHAGGAVAGQQRTGSNFAQTGRGAASMTPKGQAPPARQNLPQKTQPRPMPTKREEQKKHPSDK